MNKKAQMTADLDNTLLNNIAEFELNFTQLIQARLGIIIHQHQKKELQRTLLEACKKFQCSPQEFLNILKTAPEQSAVFEFIIARITVGETYFFREQKQMQYLKEVLLPQLINQKRSQKDLSLRIWSAGCATGEEIYSIAILLKEMLPDLTKWRINLLGTDINTLSLKKALAGTYSEWSMRSISPYFKQYYFQQQNNHYQLSQIIKDMVKFDYLNLNADDYPSIINNTNSQDLILCRNVLIYFDNQHIAHLMKKLASSLVPGGFLLLGASDPINIKATNLIFLYDKGAVFTSPDASIPFMNSNIVQPQPIKEKFKKIPTRNITHTVSSQKIQTTKSSIVDEKLITKLLNEGEWQAVLDQINLHSFHLIKPSTFILNARATALANLGELEEAITDLQKCLLIDSTNKHTYLIYALVLTELNRLQEAENILRKTLFLDHNFVIAHYQLGLLLLRNKQYNDGLKSLRNALSIAKKQDPDAIVSGAKIAYGRLVEILGYEIDLYSVTGKKDYEYRRADSQKA